MTEAMMAAHAGLREDESRLHRTLEHPVAVQQILRLLHGSRQVLEDPAGGPQGHGSLRFTSLLRVQPFHAMREGIYSSRGGQIGRRVEGEVRIVKGQARTDWVTSGDAFSAPFEIRRSPDP